MTVEVDRVCVCGREFRSRQDGTRNGVWFCSPACRSALIGCVVDAVTAARGRRPTLAQYLSGGAKAQAPRA